MKVINNTSGLLAGLSLALGVSVTAASAQAEVSLADCSLPTVEGDRGPIKKSLYVVGTFPEAAWLHVGHRKMSYKGDGIYQAVVDEKKGNVRFQFATINWNPQYTAKGLSMTAGAEKKIVRGGFEKDTGVTIPSAGKYVWSIQVDAKKKPIRGIVAKCK